MYKNHPMRRRGPGKFLFFLLVAAAFAFVLAAVVMFLWNLILPDVTGVKPLKYWQAMGILLLSRILFGSFHMGPKGRGYARKKKAYWKNKWMGMSEEERTEFKEKWKERCKSSRNPEG